MQAILVVGGAGYVGSHACKALARAGWQPVVFDNLSTGRERLVRWGPLIAADLLDREALDATFSTHRPAAVLHFAAASTVGESVSDPARYWRNNVVGALNLLEAALTYGSPPVVFSSTCAVYGNAPPGPIGEATPLGPVSPYGRTKLAIEQAIEDFGAAYGLRSMRLRYFNAAGADPEGETGESHDPETHLIPRAILAALGRLGDLTLFGDDYPTPDGTAIRDYVHVTDLADAHAAAVRLLLAGDDGGAINLGAGTGRSVREVVTAVERVTGLAVPVRTGPRRLGDPDRLVADTARARAVLGFTPTRSDLDTIVATAYRWLAGNGNSVSA